MATERMKQRCGILRERTKGARFEAEFEDADMKKARGRFRRRVTCDQTRMGEAGGEIRRKSVVVV